MMTCEINSDQIVAVLRAAAESTPKRNRTLRDAFLFAAFEIEMLRTRIEELEDQVFEYQMNSGK